MCSSTASSSTGNFPMSILNISDRLSKAFDTMRKIPLSSAKNSNLCPDGDRVPLLSTTLSVFEYDVCFMSKGM